MSVPEQDIIYVDIYAGSTLEGGFNLDVTDEGGIPLTRTDGWRLRSQVRQSFGGPLIFTLVDPDDTPADGTIELDDAGHVFVNLPSTFTETMAPTTDSTGANNRHLVGDLDVWNTAAPTVIYKPPALLRVRVLPEVTTS